MKATEMQAAGINLAVVAWLARHAKDVPTILASLQRVAAATSIDERWSAFKSAGDQIVADLADFPGLSATQPVPAKPPQQDPSGPIGPLESSHAFKAAEVDASLAAIGDGHILNSLLAIVTNPQFLQLLEFVIGLFAGVPKTG